MYDYWTKGLDQSYHSDDIIACNKDRLGQNSVYFCFFYNFPLFSEIFINIDIYMQIRYLICISTIPSDKSTISKLQFASKFNSVRVFLKVQAHILKK